MKDRFLKSTAVNDPGDFKTPYKIYGRIDLEIMQFKYQQLHNFSKGLSVRFNHGSIK